MSQELEDHKEQMISILLSENYRDSFLRYIDSLNKKGMSKKEIYQRFLHLHLEIQIDPRTRNVEALYDRLSDFMDGFTSWNKGDEILPDEPY